MNKAILINAEDWEGLFINGKLVREGHSLNEGEERIKYFLKLAKEYNFDLAEMDCVEIAEEDEEELYDCGSFPNHISKLKGNYR